MRDNPYDFEETVSEYAFPVTENGIYSLYFYPQKRPGIDIPGLHFLEILDFILSSLTILHSLHGEYEETYRPAVPARPCILHLTKINRAPEWRDYNLHKRYVQEKRTI